MPSRARARLRLNAEHEDGLRTPLQTPTQSLVFRPVERDQVGLVGIIHAAADSALTADSELDVDVVFPEDGADRFVHAGSQFLLWNGRVVGHAEISQVDGSE